MKKIQQQRHAEPQSRREFESGFLRISASLREMVLVCMTMGAFNAYAGDVSAYDDLQGKAHRANLGRTGVHAVSGAPELKRVRWSFKTGGEVRSSPVVVMGAVYVGSNDGSVYALDEKTGTLKWNAETGGKVSGSAAVTDGRVYIPAQTGLLALNAADGKEIWRYKTDAICGGSPVVANGAVIIGAGNKRSADASPAMTGPIVAINAADGTVRWTGQEGPFMTASLATDGKVLFSHYHGQYTVCSLENGKLLHNVFQTGGQRYPWGGATYAKGRAYYPLALAGYVDCYEFDAAGKPKRVWRNATHAPNLETTVHLGAEGGHEILGDLAVTDTLVLAPCWDGNLYAFSAADGKLAWKFQTGGPVMGSPSVAGDVVYFGSWDKHLYAVGLDGKLRSKIKLGGRVNSSPWPGNGVVYVGCDDGNIYAVE